MIPRAFAENFLSMHPMEQQMGIQAACSARAHNPPPSRGNTWMTSGQPGHPPTCQFHLWSRHSWLTHVATRWWIRGILVLCPFAPIFLAEELGRVPIKEDVSYPSTPTSSNFCRSHGHHYRAWAFEGEDPLDPSRHLLCLHGNSFSQQSIVHCWQS